MLDRFRQWYRGLPDKKRYIEFFTAILTVPVLVTVILINLGSLKSNKETAPEQKMPTIVITQNVPKEPTPTAANLSPTIVEPTLTPFQCTRTVGPVSITYPNDGEVVQKDPVCIDITYQQGNFCSVVWSYRINESAWSDFTDKSICLYNLAPGTKKLDLRVRSVASNDEVTLQRTFTVPGPSPTDVPPTITPTP